MGNNVQFIYPAPPPELPAMLLNAGHGVALSPQYRWDGRSRFRPGLDAPLAIWQYTLAGQGAIDIGNRTFVLDPGSAFLVTVPDDHVYYLPEGSPRWEFLYLTATGEAMVRLTRDLVKRFGPVVRHPAASRVAARTLEIIRRYENGPLPGFWQASALAYELWTMIGAELDSAGPAPEQGLLARVSEQLEKQRRPPASVAHLAAALGYSRAHFSRRFAAETGIAPGRFLRDWQLRLAASMLTSGNEPVKAVAYQAGFADDGYFCRVFRRRYGVTPDTFRRRPELARGAAELARQLPEPEKIGKIPAGGI